MITLFHLKKLLSAMVLPPFGIVLLALLGLGLMRWHHRRGQYFILFSLALLTALSLPVVADALMHSLEIYPPVSKEALSKAQAIVILGADDYPEAPEYGGDTVGRETLERLRYGARLQRETRLPILVTGGAPYGTTPGALTMKTVIEEDFRGSVQWVENASNDTAENARYSARMLYAAGITHIALVSHAWHLPRAVALFERQGLQVVPAPTGFATSAPSLWSQLLPSGDAFARSREALHEWLGLVVQRTGG
jgi:uncharacterized SAM-binding protein YcdF (DUF218 family)